MTETTTETQTPAQELRAAATKLRETASGAQDGPWRVAKGLPDDSVRTESGWEIAYSAFSHSGNLAWIALASPALAEPLADWLETEARQYDLPPCDDPTGVCNRCEWSPGILDSIRVARAINGTAS